MGIERRGEAPIGVTEMTNRTAEIRKIIKAWADKKGLKYRIRTTTDCVEFYGDFPSARGQTGWWFGGYAEEVAQQIVDGLR